MPLTSNEADVLRYLGKNSPATTRNITRALGLPRRDARNALQELADKKLVSKDSATFPPSYAITDFGASVLAAAGREPS